MRVHVARPAARRSPPARRLVAVHARGARRALAAAVAGALLACTDAPVAPAAAPPTRISGAPRAVAGAALPVAVEVPPSMRWGAFAVERALLVPAGFRAAVYARVGGARFMAVAPGGDLLVSVPGEGRIVLVRPDPGGGDPQQWTWAAGLYRPHDIVFHTLGGRTWVYVAEGDRIARYAYTAGDAEGRGREVIVSGLPSASSPELGGAYGHELKNIALDGDRLYVSIASTCNACASDAESDPVRGAVYLYGADGSGGRLYARGLRNAEGLAVEPGTGRLWVAVNNRDNIAVPFHGDVTGDGTDDYGRVIPSWVDDHPPELFTAVRDGGHYGWPFCNSTPDSPSRLRDMPLERDVELNADGGRLDCDAADRATIGLPAHSAPLGLTFFQGTNAPAPYGAGAAVALHGSWNRQRKTGYKVVFFPWDGSNAPVDLMTGWASDFDQWGRPVDVAVDAAGAILVSDDYSGTIYRITAPAAPPPAGAQLVDRNSGRCLDVAGGAAAGAPMIVYQCHGGTNQRFTLPAAGTAGEVRVGGLCLDASGWGTENGTALTAYPCHGGANQQWTRGADGELRGTSGRCVDVRGAGRVDGTSVILWDCHGGDNQRWDPR